MTVSPELFLTTPYTAPTGRDRESAPLDKPGSQGYDPASAEKSRAGFKDHLAQATDKKPSPDKKSSGKQISTAPATLANPQKTAPPLLEDKNAEKDYVLLTGADIKDGIKTGTDLTSNTIPSGDTEDTGGIAPQAAPETQPSQSSGPQSVSGFAETKIAAAPEQGGELDDQQPSSKAKVSPQSTLPKGKISEQPFQTQQSKDTTLTENSPVILPNHIPTSATDIPSKETMTSPTTDVRGQTEIIPQKGSNNQTVQYKTEEAGKSITPVAVEKMTPEAAKTTTQNAVSTNEGAAGNLVPAHGVQAEVTQTAAGAEPLAQKSEVPPQQMATAIAQPAIQKEAETGKIPRDTEGKGTDKKQAIAAAGDKNQPSPSEKAKGFTQDSAGEKKSAASAQTKSTAAGPQHILAAKIPFNSELSQAMTGTEGKPAALINAPLPTGLLSVQDISQGGLPANRLTATSQIKPAQLPVTPQMVTKQITMAIMKQADNGQQSFKLSLKPAELGQVDIRMDFQADGKMITTVTVDNERTLALLQKDQGSLEKALENAGFNAGGNDLNFSLKKQQQNQGQGDFADSDHGEDGDSDQMSAPPGSIMSHQQMKMAYSDNLLDINI